MHVKQRPRRRHEDQFKAQILAACAEPGASVSAVAQAFGVNDNLVHQWRRGRGYKANAAEAAQSPGQAQFVALALPAPSEVSGAMPDAASRTIRVELKRGALAVSVAWPIAAGGECAAWLRELLR